MEYRTVSAEELRERANSVDRAHKAHIERSLEMLKEFRDQAYTADIEYELSSIEKYYNSKLYDLRHIDASF